MGVGGSGIVDAHVHILPPSSKAPWGVVDDAIDRGCSEQVVVILLVAVEVGVVS